MQNSFIIFQKLLVLFGFMFIGYLSYKKEWITDHTESQLSGLVLNIFNPALIISGVVGSSENGNWTMVLINLHDVRREQIWQAKFSGRKIS